MGSAGNWVNAGNPGTVATPGTTDVALIQVDEGLYGVIDVAALDIVQASGAPTISITGSSTQVTAASVGIAYGFTLDTGAYLQAGALGIDGDGTSVIVQNNVYLYDLSSAENDVLTIGAGSGNATRPLAPQPHDRSANRLVRYRRTSFSERATGRSSFLKKRTKRLLCSWLSLPERTATAT